MPQPWTEPDSAAYTFETFVADDGNRSIVELCMEVSRNPGQVHNPLLLHGRTGSGKTHLLHAISNELRRADARTTVLRLSTDSLATSLIRAIRDDTVAAFRQNLLAVNALLLDDLHSLSEMPRALSEVGHHLNELVSARRQVVVTSIRPAELQLLAGHLPRGAEPALAEIRYPDLSGRMVIARHAAATIGATLSDRALRAVAEGVIRSAPEIRGVIARIEAEGAARGKALSARGVVTLLRQLGRTNGN